MIAALFVREHGVYSNLPGVDLWGLHRDARNYNGPHPVICHPPCARWGRYYSGGPMLAKTERVLQLGDDGGCFESALRAVYRWGGIIEHPADSKAWTWFGIKKPPRAGGWIRANDLGAWTCCVEQGHYGHQARKATWLYAHRVSLPDLIWGPSDKRVRLDEGFYSSGERRRIVRTGICQRLSKRQREDTPIEFRDLLISIARSAY